MSRHDLDQPVFRDHYPNANVVKTAAKKSRRRNYVIEDSGRRLLVSVTDSDSTANLAESAAVEALSRSDVPIAQIVETFEDSTCRYLVQDFLDAISVDERLRAADKDESFRLGSMMGMLLDRLHSLPASRFDGLPSPSGSWWEWIRSLRPDLHLPPGLTITDPEIAFVHNDFVPHNILLEPNTCEILALIDFEWSFLGDPTWDVGYLNWWLRTDDYPYPQDCWAGVQATYRHSVDDVRANFYASIRSPEPMTWWEGAVPPPVGWLKRRRDVPDTNAP